MPVVVHVAADNHDSQLVVRYLAVVVRVVSRVIEIRIGQFQGTAARGFGRGCGDEPFQRTNDSVGLAMRLAVARGHELQFADGVFLEVVDDVVIRFGQ